MFSSDVMMFGVKMTMQSPILEKGLMRHSAYFLSSVASDFMHYLGVNVCPNALSLHPTISFTLSM